MGDGLISTIFAVLFALIGVAILFAKVDPEQLENHVHTMPLYALYRFRWYRYLQSAICFVLAALIYFKT